MSTTITSYVIYGVEVRKSDFLTKVRKYDEDDGQPYEKIITRTALVLVSTMQEIDEGDDGLYASEAGEFGHMYADYARYGNRLLGTVLAKTSEYEGINMVPVPIPTVEEVDMTLTRLNALGITELPRIFVLTNYSY